MANKTKAPKKKTFRVTYRMEIYIKADNLKDAQDEFENMDWDKLKAESEFVERVSLDQEDDDDEEVA